MEKTFHTLCIWSESSPAELPEVELPHRTKLARRPMYHPFLWLGCFQEPNSGMGEKEHNLASDVKKSILIIHHFLIAQWTPFQTVRSPWERAHTWRLQCRIANCWPDAVRLHSGAAETMTAVAEASTGSYRAVAPIRSNRLDNSCLLRISCCSVASEQKRNKHRFISEI